MITAVKCADCGAESHIENMTIRLSPMTDDPTNEDLAVKTFVCDRCDDWFHRFGNSHVGECCICGGAILKTKAIHLPAVDAEGNMDWGSFKCWVCK